MHEGLFKSYNDRPGIENARCWGPETRDAVETFGKGVMALGHYFTNPALGNDAEWRQCVRCLQVSHTQITEDHWFAQVQTCNQHAEATRQSLMNQYLSHFNATIMKWKDITPRAFAFLYSHLFASFCFVLWVQFANL